eukprot:TRINITY_DN15872_c0_g1_i2.p1 TRINITY_DN15872_c0_g1~~TRINITY_DN15872_c0_g1_i2.p1  ORF type:complete len:136 (+),score=7.77 TRINITY_DN15872_c0_g1_i2:507-914(+)
MFIHTYSQMRCTDLASIKVEHWDYLYLNSGTTINTQCHYDSGMWARNCTFTPQQQRLYLNPRCVSHSPMSHDFQLLCIELTKHSSNIGIPPPDDHRNIDNMYAGICFERALVLLIVSPLLFTKKKKKKKKKKNFA